MAAPFLAMALWPDLARRLPKPGRWMLAVKKAMALALLGTAAWLLWVLGNQAGALASALVAGAMALAVAVIAFKDRLPESSRASLGAVVGVLALFAVAAPLRFGAEQTAEAPSSTSWQKFDPDRIERLVAEGKTVFVDVTADWCITCKVNKAAVIERGEVARRLSAPDMVAMKADWTRPDDAIARYLASFGRYGIPFDVVYGPKAPQGIALSELLTEAETMAALDRAK
jgi:suppressor for copper-sensitivity B